MLVLVDKPAAHVAIAGDSTVKFRGLARRARRRASTSSASTTPRRSAAGKVTLRDYDFKKPGLAAREHEQERSVALRRSRGLRLPRRLRAPGDGDALRDRPPRRAQALAQAARAGRERLRAPHPRLQVHPGRAPARGPQPRVPGHAHRAPGRRAGDGASRRRRPRATRTASRCIPSDVPFRPRARHAAADGAAACRRAIVVGPVGRGDPHRRARPREGPVPLGPAGQEGRQELVLDPREPDLGRAGAGARCTSRASARRCSSTSSRAIPTARSSSAASTTAPTSPPYALPANKTQSTHQVQLHRPAAAAPTSSASRTRRAARRSTSTARRTGRSSSRTTRTRTSATTRRSSVGNDRTDDVGNDQTESIGHDETFTVKHDRAKSVGNDENESIGHDRTISVGNDHTESIGNNLALSVAKSKTEDVGDDAPRASARPARSAAARTTRSTSPPT